MAGIIDNTIKELGKDVERSSSQKFSWGISNDIQ
jgi:hypothetical protein